MKFFGTQIFSKRRESLIVAILLALFVLQGVLALRHIAPTWDEIGHLPAGYSYLKTNDYRIYPANPPLIKQIAALPLLFFDLKLPLDDPNWEREREIEFGQAFFYHANAGIDVDQLFFWARLMMILLGAGLGWLVYLWAKELFGQIAALLALTLYAFNPNVLAHTTLVTCDIGFTLFFFLSNYTFYFFMKAPSLKRLFWAALAFGLAMISKFTAVILLPIYIAIFVFRVIFRKQSLSPLLPMRLFENSKWRDLLSVAVVLVIFLLLGAGMISLDYGLSGEPLIRDGIDETKLETVLDRFSLTREGFVRNSLKFVATEIPIPGRSYLTAFATVMGFTPRLESEESFVGRQKFLMGRRDPDGFWYFPYVAFLIKTPLPLILLFILSLMTLRREDLKFLEFFLVPIVILLASTLLRPDFAYRYVNLPMLPFIIVLTSRVVNWEWMKRLSGRIALVVLLLWSAAAALWIHPHYLAYFNELIGGPKNGYKYILDSNLDWGQDLIGLKKYMQQHKIEKVKLSYNGTAYPEYYGIQYQRLLGVDGSTFDPLVKVDAKAATQPTDGMIAISATCLQNIQGFYPEASYEWLKNFEPIATIGYTIFIFDIKSNSVIGQNEASQLPPL